MWQHQTTEAIINDAPTTYNAKLHANKRKTFFYVDPHVVYGEFGKRIYGKL